ncbi:MAG: site-specific DNA-methyltransferase, partial [Desulfosalsimonas sp.]
MTSQTAFSQLQAFLKEMFQFDDHDLDFGIYRIIRLKQNFIAEFIDGDGQGSLQATVQDALARVRNAAGEAARNWLEAFSAQFGEKGKSLWQELCKHPNDPAARQAFEKILELSDESDRQQAEKYLQTLADSDMPSGPDLEARVYNHLLNFFELYYSNGDFGYNTRAANAFKVPYEADYDGSDTLFHWKHKDSYYIKTGSGFRSVRCRVNDAWLEFKMQAGAGEPESTARNNVKENSRKHYRLDDIRRKKEKAPDGAGAVIWEVLFCLAPESTPKTEIYRRIWETVFADGTDLTPYLYKKPEKKQDSPGKPLFNDLSDNHDQVQGGQIKAVSQLRLKEETYFTELARRDEFRELGKNAQARADALRKDAAAAALFEIDRRLNTFYAGNDADFFIHRDLAGFLTREKQRFIKNVIFSDANGLLEAGTDNATVEIARAFSRVADRVIGFLDAIETFQKNLFELKKKVVDTHYLISAGKIPKAFYSRLLANDLQIREWREIFCTQVNSEEDLENHPTLVVDTSLFKDIDPELEEDILSHPAFDNLDEQTDGLLINSENWQALNLLDEKYREKVKCIYIDPPYNTGGDGFLYKDAFRHSSWISMMEDRLCAAASLMSKTGTITQAIGREELANLLKLNDCFFGEKNRVGELIWEKGRKNDAKFFSIGHDYMLVYAKDLEHLQSSGIVWREEKPGAREILDEYRRLKKIHGNDVKAIEKGIREFYKTLPKGHSSLKHKRYNRVDQNGIWRDKDISWPGGDGPRYEIIHPKTKKPCKVPDRGWAFATPERFWLYYENGFIEFRADHTEPPKLKRYLNYVPMEFDSEARRQNSQLNGADDVNVQVMPSVFYKSQQPTIKELRHIMGTDVFSNPKDPGVLARLIDYVTDEDSIVLDFFAGSGTTGHAVLDLNRKANGGKKRHFQLVEMGSYFNEITKPRIKKLLFTFNWKNGQPENEEGYQGLVKVQALEQYEDTLD